MNYLFQRSEVAGVLALDVDVYAIISDYLENSYFISFDGLPFRSSKFYLKSIVFDNMDDPKKINYKHQTTSSPKHLSNGGCGPVVAGHQTFALSLLTSVTEATSRARRPASDFF